MLILNPVVYCWNRVEISEVPDRAPDRRAGVGERGVKIANRNDSEVTAC